MFDGQHYGVYLIVLGYLAVNVYFFFRFTTVLNFSRLYRLLLGLFLLLLFLSFPLGRYLGRYDFNSFTLLLTIASSVWLGFALFFGLCAGFWDILSFSLKKSRFGRKIPFADRLYFGPLLLTSIFFFAVFLGGCALREARQITITGLEIPVRNLPPGLDGITLVQVSDVHYGMINENGRLSKIVDLVNGLDPDIVVFTGDLADEKISHLEKMTEPLSRLRSRLGVYAVLGNHEYYAGVERMTRIFEEAKIRLLRNEIEEIAGGIQLLGFDDPTGYRRMKEPKPDYEALFSKLDPHRPSILLFHPPLGFDQAANHEIGLQLSGHTHGAQIFPIRPIAEILYPCVRGLHRLDQSYLYVSRGLGTGGPPMRLGSPPEIVLIRLRTPT